MNTSTSLTEFHTYAQKYLNDWVTDQCGKLANQGLGIDLSDSIKQVAIAIGTAEM